MYESFYNFKEKPFSLTPDPGFLYLGKQHREGLTMLEYGLEVHGGITVFTGEVGSGKTTLVRKILEIPPCTSSPYSSMVRPSRRCLPR